MVTVNQCCCGCSLRTGTLIIGYLHVLGGVLLGLACVVAVAILKQNEDDFIAHNYQVLYSALLIVCIIGIVLGMIQIVVSILLVYGGHKGKPGFMMPWMIYSGITFGLAVLAAIFAFIQVIMGNAAAFGQIIGYVCNGAILWYFVVVVHSYRKTLQTNDGIVLVPQTLPTKFDGQIFPTKFDGQTFPTNIHGQIQV